MMTSYTAVFSNGCRKHIGKSSREYSHAWLVVVERSAGQIVSTDGFARSYDLAAAAVATESKRLCRDYRTRRPITGANITLTEIVPVVREQ